MMRSAYWTAAGFAALELSGASAQAAERPALVDAFVRQLVRQCGGEMTPALVGQVVRQIDLNGDKLDDWVVDESQYPCPTRPAAFADRGRSVTVFLSRADGQALPAFQRAAFGARIEKTATGYALWVTLGGSDCGEADPKARCDRKLAWRAKENRLSLVEPEGRATKTAPPPQPPASVSSSRSANQP